MYRQPLSVSTPLNLIPASNYRLDDPIIIIIIATTMNSVHLPCIILLNSDSHNTFVTAWLAACHNCYFLVNSAHDTFVTAWLVTDIILEQFIISS